MAEIGWEKEKVKIRLDELTVDPEIQLQSRGLDPETVQAYVEAMSNDAQMPPIVLYRENGHYWLADGYHRMAAAEFLGLAELPAEVREGTRQDALVYAATANVKNGKPMSQAQKREAGERLLRLTKWSQHRIAQELAVKQQTVSNWAHTMTNKNLLVGPREVVGQDGRCYDTSNIGRRCATFQPDPDFGPLVHGPIGDYREHNGTKQCEKCGNLWAADLDYCPYCNISREARILHLQRERQGASQQVEVTLFSHKSVEYYTPSQYIKAACEVMGGIDLDPASCEDAQEWIQAGTFYTEDDDGLIRPWFGRVWLNPPYSYRDGQSNQEIWSQALIDHYLQGDVSEAILLVKAALGYNWFESLWWSWPVCFGRERLSFIKSDGTDEGQSKQASAFFYFGPSLDRFQQVFRRFGRVILPEEE